MIEVNIDKNGTLICPKCKGEMRYYNASWNCTNLDCKFSADDDDIRFTIDARFEIVAERPQHAKIMMQENLRTLISGKLPECIKLSDIILRKMSVLSPSWSDVRDDAIKKLEAIKDDLESIAAQIGNIADGGDDERTYKRSSKEAVSLADASNNLFESVNHIGEAIAAADDACLE